MTNQRYAQIIVDVPTMQTNQPYTYLIPEAMQDTLQPGMRVDVPFGAASPTSRVGLPERA